MRVFIFGANRFESTTTPSFFNEACIPYTYLVHTEEQKQGFIQGGRVPEQYLHVTNRPKGLAYNRNAALDLMEDGEWALFLVDDLLKLQEYDAYDEASLSGILPVDTTNSTDYGRRFRSYVPIDQFLHRMEECKEQAERFGAHLVGFTANHNPLFRRKKWITKTLADGRCWVIQKTHLRFDERVHTVEDYAFTARNIEEFGVVLVNNWILPDCSRYTAGGVGTLSERMRQHRAECMYLAKRFPKILRLANKKHFPLYGHLRFR